MKSRPSYKFEGCHANSTRNRGNCTRGLPACRPRGIRGSRNSRPMRGRSMGVRHTGDQEPGSTTFRCEISGSRRRVAVVTAGGSFVESNLGRKLGFLQARYPTSKGSNIEPNWRFAFRCLRVVAGAAPTDASDCHCAYASSTRKAAKAVHAACLPVSVVALSEALTCSYWLHSRAPR